MYHYLFTNDLRISTLDESLKKAGHCFATDTVPTSAEDKSANNNMMTLGFYFNLTKDSNCSKVAASGDSRSVVLNFIKKFQFPNMRTQTAYNEAKEDGIILAPMRQIIKVLYIMNLLYGSTVAYLTKEEIINFIFYNENIAKREKANLSDLIHEIVEYRKTGIIPESVETSTENREWKHEDRQIREMLKVLLWSGCISEMEGKYIIDNDGLSRNNKADIFDIINYDSFWNGNTIESYRAYMDIDASLDIEINGEEDPEEKNKRLFRYWMELQVKPEGDSDAGNPYSKTSIDQYVSNIANTQLINTPDKSVFYTTDTGEVEVVIEYLDNAEKKNNTQRSAVRKYLEYLIEAPSQEDIDEVFSHSVYGFHIKAKNDSLSDQNPHVCIGWSDMGDMTSLDSRESVAEEYDKHYDKSANAKGQDVGQIWRFINDVQIGDYVIYAESSVFHIGRVESDFYYDNTVRPEQDADYTNNRKVRWIKKNLSRKILSDNLHNSLKTAMSIWTLNDYKSAVADLIRGTYKKDDATDMDEMLEIKFKTEIETEYERNRIVFGAPGTGKSFGLKQDSEKMLEGTSGYFERVTFHPDYSYSQFVGTYKPVMDMDGNIRYDFVPGPFMRVYVNALKNGASGNPQPNLLLIEEINRAKVAAVFGDVFQLLDRDEDGVSEYEIQTSEDIRKYLMKELHVTEDKVEKIRIPDNMFIWATMNSADQGVFPMDTAFKRRWNFEYLGINESQDEISGIGKIVLADSEEPVEWNVLRKAINEKMSSSDFKINEDKLMGPFFLSKKAIASDDNGMIKDPGKFIDAFKSKVIMYLYEDAVKQGKHRFFDGCTDTGKYSSVCDEFDRIGLGIFGSTFRELYYDKQRDEA